MCVHAHADATFMYTYMWEEQTETEELLEGPNKTYIFNQTNQEKKRKDINRISDEKEDIYNQCHGNTKDYQQLLGTTLCKT